MLHAIGRARPKDCRSISPGQFAAKPAHWLCTGCAHSDSVDELEACVVKLALGLQMRTWMCDSTDELEEAP